MNANKLLQFLLLSMLTMQSITAQTRLNDSLALVDLYAATNGPGWASSWDFNQPMDIWAGVTLDYNLPGGRVTFLTLDGTGLSDTIPDLNLTELESLRLGNNQLSGHIPDFSNLPKLTYLYLDGNQLTGSIPDFSYLPNLEVLYLWFNELSGNIPDFSNIPKLTYLELLSNNLKGNIPNFSNLPDLIGLNLWYNQLSGNIPDFSNLPELTYLSVRNNQLSGNIPDFMNLPSLTELALNNNQFSGSIPNFSNLPALTNLVLDQNQLTGNIPDFSNLSTLQNIYVNNNQLFGKIPFFTNQPLLGKLHVHQNSFTFEDIIDSRQFNEDLCNSNVGTGIGYDYSTQDSIGLVDSIYVVFNTGYTLDLIVDDTVSTNIYYWFKNGLPYDTSFVNKLYFPNFQSTDVGEYHVQIANQLVPALQLYSRPKTLLLDTCTVSSSETLEGGAPPFLQVCPDDDTPYYVYDAIQNTINFNRYVFFINGQVVQDSSTNVFIPNNNIEHLDTITASAFDDFGCRYDIPNKKVINAFEKPEITLCSITADSVQLQLTNGIPPWSCDLLTYEGTTQTQSAYLEVYSTDTILNYPTNTHFVLQNLNLLSNNCSPTTEAYFSSIIEGCTAVCVGYTPGYTEVYQANFPTPAFNFQWTVTPDSAITNGSISILGGLTTSSLEIDFSNSQPLVTAITLQVTADTDCGTEILSKTVKLDQHCVWPGDVNDDGQVNTSSDINWIDDALGLGFAYVDYQAYLNNQNNSVLHTHNRPPVCLAQNSSDWVPQSSKDWELELFNGNRVPAIYDIKDSNGNTVAAYNLKYADCNGNSAIEYARNWDESFDVPFSSVPNPTDHDIIVHHAINNKTHNGNSASKTSNTLSQIFHIEAQDSIYNNGDEIVFIVKMGDAQNPVKDVSQLALVGEGSFGTYKQPAVHLYNSHLTNDYNNLVDHPFRYDDANGNPSDSLRWHIALRKSTNSVDFAGEEVCQIVCMVTPAEFYNAPSQKNAKSPSESFPITFQISAAGIGHSGDSTSYGSSNKITVWVRPVPILNARVFLAGPYDSQTGLMRDDLRTSKLIPMQEPYHSLPGFTYPQPEMHGILMDSTAITATGQDAIVDWVFVEIHNPQDSSIVGARPALLKRNGKLVDMNGESPVRLPGVVEGNYHVVIRHRNHLPVKTMNPVTVSTQMEELDFSTGQIPGQQQLMANGRFALIEGDTDGNHIVDAADRSAIWNQRNQTGYLRTDIDLDGQIDASDRSKAWNNKNRFVAID